MGAVKLELRCPQSANGIIAEPLPDWSFDALLSEINSLELKLNPVTFTDGRSREFTPSRRTPQSSSAFVMHLSDDELEDEDSDCEEVPNRSIVVGRRFACDDLSPSDDSEDDSLIERQTYAIAKTETGEGALVELNREQRFGVQEEIRGQISILETDLISESEKFNSSVVRLGKYCDARRDLDKKLDTQYQRKIAEALDSHLTAIQRDHEHWSQIEERKIRNDAAIEDAKRKEKAIKEERRQQEKAKAEAEAQLLAAKKKAEEEKLAALAAEEKAAKEAAKKINSATPKTLAADVARRDDQLQQFDSSLGSANVQVNGSTSKGQEKLQHAGKILHSAESALKLEESRLQKCKEVETINQALRSESNKDFRSYERQIARQIKQTSGTKDGVRAKANELIKILNDPMCPQSISIAMLANKVISLSENPGSAPFALSHVIVLVTSKFPLAMDLILAEFHRACIFSVPKHISYSERAFETKDAYKKAIGFREEDGKLESVNKYLERVESHMRLYGALVQTEIEGVQNMHGLKEGWAWLARLLNALPANIFTAVALEAFLKMAGFALFRKYKSQFRKILKIISVDFVGALKKRKTPGLELIIRRIESYLETSQFLEEPEGWRLPSSALSNSFVPTSDYGDPYYPQSNRFSYF